MYISIYIYTYIYSVRIYDTPRKVVDKSCTDVQSIPSHFKSQKSSNIALGLWQGFCHWDASNVFKMTFQGPGPSRFDGDMPSFTSLFDDLDSLDFLLHESA